MEEKLIFLDVDGTLTLPGTLTPPNSAQEAIRQARAAGHRVFLCTGRSASRFQPLMELGFDGAVGSAGGYVVCGGEVLYDHPMPHSLRDKALSALEQAGLAYIVETARGDFGTPSALEQITKAKVRNSEINRWKAVAQNPAAFRRLADYQGDLVYKIVFIGPDPSVMPQVEAALGDDFSVCLHNIFRWDGIVHGELISRDFDKGSGIRRICRHLGVPLSATIGFGDSMNDLTMLETVGTSVCMGNGAQSVKDISHMVCPPMMEDGLAKGFRQLGLL